MRVMRVMRVIGMMSGTSYDAMDAAAADLTLDGETIVLEPRGLISEPYPQALRASLAAAMPPAATTLRDVCRLDTGIGQAFAGLAARANAELCGGTADLVVSHGQTVYHWVDEGPGSSVLGTLQLGEPAWIAERTGVPVVSGLRSRDVAAGGQGAPLVSSFDVLWLGGRPGTPVALNLGGIANITVLSPGAPIAFDTGPANALIDAAVRQLTGGESGFDQDGHRAARGVVHEGLLRTLLDDEYYARPAPKSTGKERFHLPYLQAARAGFTLAPDDVIATLTQLTAVTVADAVRRHGGDEVVAAGGGTRNPTLMRALEAALDGVPLRTSADLGIPPEAKEAYAFALLGWLSVHGHPGTVPSCTGARHASVLGSLTPGRGPLPHAVLEVQPARLRVLPSPGEELTRD